MTVGAPPPNLTRAPFELGCRPSPASITPAFTSSSLNLPISRSSSSFGIWPASYSSPPFTRTMKRIALLPSLCRFDLSTDTSNEHQRNRQARGRVTSASSAERRLRGLHSRPGNLPEPVRPVLQQL